MMMPELSSPPGAVWTNGAFAWGRYRGPIIDARLGPMGRLTRFRLKEWHYSALTTERWFVAFAVVQLGYLANAFCYVVDRQNPARRREWSALSPLGRALTFAESSVRGTTCWRRGRNRIVISSASSGAQVSIDIGLGSERLVGSFHLTSAPSLSVVFPLAPGRAAYTHKSLGLRAAGRLAIGGEPIPLDDALATLDWTRSIANRTTRWKWASFVGRLPDGRPLGINLSAEVYDDARGDSVENAVWLGDAVHPVHAVNFDLPPNPTFEPWRIQSRDGNEVDLLFTPLGARAENVNLGIVRSDFVQPFGTFAGTLTPGAATVRVDGLFGVVERHVSVW
jgi:hypothetical protein